MLRAMKIAAARATSATPTAVGTSQRWKRSRMGLISASKSRRTSTWPIAGAIHSAQLARARQIVRVRDVHVAGLPGLEAVRIEAGARGQLGGQGPVLRAHGEAGAGVRHREPRGSPRRRILQQHVPHPLAGEHHAHLLPPRAEGGLRVDEQQIPLADLRRGDEGERQGAKLGGRPERGGGALPERCVEQGQGHWRRPQLLRRRARVDEAPAGVEEGPEQRAAAAPAEGLGVRGGDDLAGAEDAGGLREPASPRPASSSEEFTDRDISLKERSSVRASATSRMRSWLAWASRWKDSSVRWRSLAIVCLAAACTARVVRSSAVMSDAPASAMKARMSFRASVTGGQDSRPRPARRA